MHYDLNEVKVLGVKLTTTVFHLLLYMPSVVDEIGDDGTMGIISPACID